MSLHDNDDQNGNFELEVPTGQGILQIQTGNGKLFNSSFEIDVIPGTILDLTSQNLRLESNSNLAFLAGSYDSIENIITDLGYTIDEVTIADIENGLSGYDAVFLNCTGNLSSFSDAFYQGLNNFVTFGNSIYSSDFSLEYLIGFDNYSQNCSDVREGGFIGVGTVCGTRSGDVGWLYNNTILNADIINHLGTSFIDVEYDADIWMQLQNVDENFWEILIKDENANPLMIKTNQVQGGYDDDSIWYSNNGNKVTICHIPPGNSANAHEITISVNALDTHLAHGDSIGACNASSGNIYYTTFHNHTDGTATPEVESMMEYIVLNL